MELREWALQILSADTLEAKLFCPDVLTDQKAGPSLRFQEPVRPLHMKLQKWKKSDKLPPFDRHHIEANRAVCLHRFAGHELLAVEIMADALLAFPEAPKSFRKGVAHTLKEEQGHVRLYMDRMQEMGLQLGDLPLYRHFWGHVRYLNSPLQYISMMSLTFEMANLDFAPLYESSFAKVGDCKSQKLMQQIVLDEIRHVSFGYSWLNKLKEKDSSSWESWTSNLPPTLVPRQARGSSFQEELRRKAHIPEDWIGRLKKI